MKKILSKVILLTLCLCMIGSICALPLSIYAANSQEEPTFNTSTPVWLYDFTDLDIAATFYNVAKLSYTFSDEGHITFTAQEDDPNLYLETPTVDVNAMKYVAIEQRTTAPRKGEFYVNRTDGVTMGQEGSHVQYDLPTSGNWETTITPCTQWASAADGVKFNVMRFDPMELKVQAGESIDIRFVAFFASEADAKAFDLDEYKAMLAYQEEQSKPDPNDSSMPTWIYDFTNSDVETKMGGMNNLNYEFKDGYISFTALGDDPNVILTPPTVTLDKLKYARIEQKTLSKRQGEFYVDRSDGKKMGEVGTNVKYTLNSTGEWATVITPCDAWADADSSINISSFRYDPIQLNVTAGETIDVKYVAFFETEQEAIAFNYDIYLKKLAEEEENKKQEEEASKEVEWPTPVYKDKTTTEADTNPGTLTYTPSQDGKTVTISYAVNGETRTFTVPNTNQYKSGPFAATDDLGRSLYAPTDVGVIGNNGEHYVGLFYFLWHGEHGDNGVYDIDKILAAGGDKPEGAGLFGKVNEWHWFGEPLYGYYYAKDAWVMRKHAELLCNIGIDFLYFDVTNNSAYTYNALQLMGILHELNEEGYDAPDVVFYTNTNATQRVKEIYDRIYAKNLYPDTWFMLDGKPVIIAPYEANINDFFTIKLNQWPNEEEHKDNAWPWIDFQWPQRIYNDANGNPSAINVSTAQHSGTIVFSDSVLYGDYTNRGRSYGERELRDRYLKEARNAWLKDPTLSYQGLNFQAQWDYAIKNDVEFVLVTGWNEWIATRQDGVAYYNDPNRIVFVDTFNTEYSRDIEMMKGGYFDNYYVQLAYNIQKLKGTAPIVVQDSRKPINVTGEFDQWTDVVVDYADPTGDTIHRDALGFGQTKYTNDTGRNDIMSSKVTNDTQNLYVYAQTKYDISMFDKDSAWMQLYLNTDSDVKTGWCGYDFIINYEAKDAFTTTLAKYNGKDGAYSFEIVGDVSYRAKDNELMIEIPLSVLGYTNYHEIYFEFKWVDSTSKVNTMEQFYTDGDCAPLGRLNYIYQTYIPGVSITPEIETQPEVEADTMGSTPVQTEDETGEANGGCASIAGGTSFLLIIMLASASLVCIRKKHED